MGCPLRLARNPAGCIFPASMRILDRYIGGQVLLTTAFAVFVLSIVLVLGNVFRELFPRIADGMISPVMAVKFIFYILPYTLAYTIPWGFLTAVLLVFGRLSADSEFIAIRSSGVSFLRLSAPVAVLAVVLAGFCLMANCWFSPWAERTSKRMVEEQALFAPQRLFVPKTPIELAEGMNVWVGDRKDNKLENLYIFQSNKAHQVEQFVVAERAELLPRPERRELVLKMTNAYIEGNEHQGARQTEKRPMFAQEHAYALDLSDLAKIKFRPSQMTNSQIFTALRTGQAEGAPDGLEKKQRRSLRFEISKRLSMGLGCLAFALVAVPLGITSQRRETSIGFVTSLGLALAYFLFVFIAETFRTDGSVLPYVLLWLPNILFFALGGWLCWRLNRT